MRNGIDLRRCPQVWHYFPQVQGQVARQELGPCSGQGRCSWEEGPGDVVVQGAQGRLGELDGVVHQAVVQQEGEAADVAPAGDLSASELLWVRFYFEVLLHSVWAPHRRSAAYIRAISHTHFSFLTSRFLLTQQCWGHLHFIQTIHFSLNPVKHLKGHIFYIMNNYTLCINFAENAT